MAGSAAELGFEKGLNEFPGKFGSFDAASKANQVHVVILDALARREIVFDQARANAFDFVGADRSANAAAAYGDAAFKLAFSNGAGEGNDEVRVIIGGVEHGGAEVNDFVAGGLEARGEFLFEFKSAVVGCDSNAHIIMG